MSDLKLSYYINRIKDIYKDRIYIVMLIVFAYIYISGQIGVTYMNHANQLSYDMETATDQSVIIQPQEEIQETIKINGNITKILLQHSVLIENAEQSKIVDINVIDSQGQNIVENVTVLQNQTEIYLKDYNPNDSLTLIVRNISDSIPIQYVASYEKSIGNGIGDLVIKKQIDYTMYETYTNVKVFFVFATVVCFVLLFKIHEDTQNKNGMARVLCAIIIFSTIIIRYSDFLFNGYGYFEYWGIYIDKANTYGWSSISIPDAGYLPLLNRLLTIALSYLPMGRGVQNLFLTIFAVLFVVYVLTRFVSKIYNHVLPLADRIILVLLFGCTLQNEQMITVLNYTYFSGLLITLIYLQDFSSLSLKERIKDVILSVCIVSKVALLGFFPPLLIVFIYDVVKKKKARIPQDIACIGMSCIQILYLLKTGASDRTSGGLIESILNATYSFVHSIASFILQNFDYENISYRIDLFICACLIILFGIICLYILSKSNINMFFAYFIIFSAAYISCFMNIISNFDWYFQFTNYNIRFRLGGLGDGGYTKNIFLVVIFICCTILVGIHLTHRIKKIKYARAVIYAVSLIMLLPSFRIVYADSKETTNISSNYEIYNKIDEVWAVPLNNSVSFSVKESILGQQDTSYIGYFGNGEMLLRQNDISESTVYGATHDVLLDGNSISTIDINAIEAARRVKSDSVAMYCLKLFDGQNKELYMTCYDGDDNIVCKYKAIDSNNLLLTFILDTSYFDNITKICIEDENGNISSIKNAMWVCGQMSV